MVAVKQASASRSHSITSHQSIVRDLAVLISNDLLIMVHVNKLVSQCFYQLHGINPLTAEYFIPFPGYGVNFFTNLHLAQTFFNVYCLARTFIFGTHVFQVEN